MAKGGLTRAFDKMPKLLKFILAIPVLDIIWVIYRIVKSIEKGSTFGVILGILLLIIGIPFMWLIDMITILISNRVIWVC